MSLYRIGIGLIMLITISCSPIYYAPFGLHIPGDVGKNEFELRGAYHMGDITGFEGQVTYGLDSNWSVSGLYGSMSYTRERTIQVNGSARVAELGLYYRKELSGNWLWGIKPSVLHCNFETDAQSGPFFPVDTRYIFGAVNSRFTSFRLLPFMQYDGPQFDVYVGARLSTHSYSRTEGDLFDGGQNQIEYLRALGKQWFVEPGVGLSFGRRGWSIFSEFVYVQSINNAQLPIDPAVWLTGLRWNPFLVNER